MFRFKCILISILILMSNSLFANDIGKNEIKHQSISFFPFVNYSNSNLKFVSKYISEQFKENFNSKENIVLYDYNDLKSKNIDLSRIAKVADLEYVKKILKEIKSDMAVTGRYIVHGKNISINWYILIPSENKIIKGDDFTGTADDKLIKSISDFTIAGGNWIKTSILKESIGTNIILKDDGFFKGIVSTVEKSSFGIIIQNRWSRFFLIIAFFLIVSKLVVYLFERVFLRIASKTKTDVDQKIIQFSKKPTFYIVIIFGFKLSIYSLNTTSLFALLSDKFLTGFIIILLAHLLSKSMSLIIYSWGKKVAERLDSRIDDDLIPLFDKVTRVLIYTIALIMVLSRFGINIAPLIASLGIAGFAIGFAVKDTLSNIIGGVILILDHSFVVGDKVTIDGDTGVIKEVGLRNTKLQTYDNEVIVIPNGELMNMKYKNYVLPDPKIRVVINFGVAYGTDIDLVAKVVNEAIGTIESICDDPPPAVDFMEMADFSLNFIAKFWVPVYADQYSKKLEGTKVIYNVLNENNIDIPFPTHTVFIEK